MGAPRITGERRMRNAPRISPTRDAVGIGLPTRRERPLCRSATPGGGWAVGHTRVRPCGVERQLYAFPRRRIPRRKTREGRDRPLRRMFLAPSGRKGDPAWPPAENRRGILASVILSDAKDLLVNPTRSIFCQKLCSG